MSPQAPPLKAFAATDIGLLRANNEDAWATLTDIGFFALADGMGGHKAGEVAAQEALEALCASVRGIAKLELSLTDVMLELKGAIQRANHLVYQKGMRDDELFGMGTTLCCLYWIDDAVVYAHVGDSRIYRIRNRCCEQLTIDHSLYAKWLAHGRIAEECETPFPYKNVLTKAIGAERFVEPEVSLAIYQPEDQFLLCSDGLSDVLEPHDIEKIVGRSGSLDQAVGRLIERAKIKGSGDNITALMVEYDLFRQQLDNPARP